MRPMLNETRTKIFWSWQSDTPASSGRDFVKECLRDAIKQFSEASELNEADRPELDHDTKGAPGLVAIADTIFEKIDAAALFVADVSFTGASLDGTKKTPNPNVLIELGYAFKSLGAPRIVLVANRADGFKPEDLPFDLRHRRGPITYDLPTGADKAKRTAAKTKLTKDLAEALGANWAAIPPLAVAEPELYPSIPEDPALWFKPDQKIELHDKVTSELAHGSARAYLRIAPYGWTGPKPVRRVVVAKGFQPFGEFSSGSSSVANPMGVISGGWRGKLDKVTAVTQWFEKTGEIWGVSPSYGYEHDRSIYLATGALYKQWKTRLSEWLQLYNQLRACKTYRVEAGLTGAQGLVWPGGFFAERQECMDSEIRHVHTDSDWSDKAQDLFLTEVFGKILDSFSMHRMTVDEVKALGNR